MKPYLDLSIPATKRLAWLKHEGQRLGKNWRLVRVYYGLPNLSGACGALTMGLQLNKTPIWYTFEDPYFRNEHFADQCNDAPFSVRKHTGWYTDGQLCNDTARGIVGQLPHGRYITGYYWSMNGERVYFPEVYSSEREAALAADERARIFGEQESEYQDQEREKEKESSVSTQQEALEKIVAMTRYATGTSPEQERLAKICAVARSALSTE